MVFKVLVLGFYYCITAGKADVINIPPLFQLYTLISKPTLFLNYNNL